MADDPKSGQQQDGEAKDFELEVAGEHDDDGSNKEELYDANGKPLPWNQSKRFRKLYGEAKEGRKVNAALKELGLAPKDLPRLREDLARLEQFDTAYENWQKSQAKGDTTPTEDKEAAEAKAQAAKMRKILKDLGVVLKDDEEESKAVEQKQAQTHQANVVRAATNRIAELAEDAGYDLDKMDDADRQDLLEEFDFRISKIIARDDQLRLNFTQGSLRPIEKAFKLALDKISVKPSRKGGTGIGNLPPRVSSSSAGSARAQSKVVQEPKTIKEAG